jgi:hypothetical protein
MSAEEKKEKSGAETTGSEEEIPKRKVDVRSALALIPPASQLLGREKRVRERRIRLRFHNELKEGVAKINPNLLRELGGGEYIEVVVAGRHRFRYKVEEDESVPLNEVWVNGEKLPEYGIADNSIATVRAIKTGQ